MKTLSNKINAVYRPESVTTLQATEWDALASEVENVITAGGLSPDGNDNAQMAAAVQNIAATAVAPVEAKIPAEASTSNQLADKNYVANRIAQLAARRARPTGNGNTNWSTLVQLQAGPCYYAEGASWVVDKPANNDYALIQYKNDAVYGSELWRAIFNAGAWAHDYMVDTSVSSALSLRQMNATADLDDETFFNNSDYVGLVATQRNMPVGLPPGAVVNLQVRGSSGIWAQKITVGALSWSRWYNGTMWSEWLSEAVPSLTPDYDNAYAIASDTTDWMSTDKDIFVYITIGGSYGNDEFVFVRHGPGHNEVPVLSWFDDFMGNTKRVGALFFVPEGYQWRRSKTSSATCWIIPTVTTSPTERYARDMGRNYYGKYATLTDLKNASSAFLQGFSARGYWALVGSGNSYTTYYTSPTTPAGAPYVWSEGGPYQITYGVEQASVGYYNSEEDTMYQDSARTQPIVPTDGLIILESSNAFCPTRMRYTANSVTLKKWRPEQTHLLPMEDSVHVGLGSICWSTILFDNGRAFAFGSTSVWTSGDHGRTWNKTPYDNPSDEYQASCVSDNIGYLIGKTGSDALQRFYPSGIRDLRLISGLPGTILGLAPKNAEELYALSQSGQLFTVPKKGGTATLKTTLPITSNLSGLGTDGQGCFIATQFGSATYAISTDYGETWRTLSISDGSNTYSNYYNSVAYDGATDSFYFGAQNARTAHAVIRCYNSSIGRTISQAQSYYSRPVSSDTAFCGYAKGNFNGCGFGVFGVCYGGVANSVCFLRTAL